MPKIIIGVGGTGTKIIREISRRWETTGHRPRGVALAVIDARDTSPENGEIPGAIFIPNKPVNFGDEFAAFKKHLDWWPSVATPVSWINFSDGCGAMRPYGRFFAFYYASKIRRTIEEATSSLVLRNREGNVGGHGLAFSIIVVGSLGNGTGGGTMLDVATLARHHISYATKQITCLGIFIPGSVTRTGNVGFLGKRVAASGFASLLELQYEFNRADASAELRPNSPYKFVGWSGVDFTEFRPGGDEELSTPYDAVLLLDRRDRKGLEVDYPALINIASEGISMLAEGGDADSRLVDSFTMVAAGGAKRFGSLGAARVTVPGTELLQYSTSSHALSVIGRAGSADEEEWLDLLADETPGEQNKRYLKREDATIASSVDFFFEHILHVKETEVRKPKGGKSFNQLFDRFAIDDDRTIKEFEAITQDLARLKEPTAIYNRALQIDAFVNERTGTLAEKREAALNSDPESSLFLRPRNPMDPLNVGVQTLINERVLEFVRAGAFGLLVAWLKEFNGQLDVNRKSIDEYERKEWLRDKSHESIELRQPIEKLHQIVDSMLAAFRKKALLEGVGLVRQQARNKLMFHLWDSKVKAVQAFYGRVEGHVDRLRVAAELVTKRLNEPTVVSRFERMRNSAVHKLDANGGGDPMRAASTGIKAEFFIGGDSKMRAGLLDRLHATDSTTETALLQQLAKQHEKLYADRLRGDATELGLQELNNTLPEDSSSVYSAYSKVLEKTVSEAVEPLVADRCSIDKVLEEEALALALRYRDTLSEQSAKVTDRKIAAVRKDIDTFAGQRIRERVERLHWDDDETDALDNAVDLLIAGRLYMLSQHATPQWSLAENALRTKHITAHCFVTYPSSARRVDEAIRLAMNNTLTDVELKPQADDYADKSRIDLVFVELGANLDALRNEQEVEDYRWAMLEEKSFSPHITEQYRAMGLRYLSKAGYQMQPGAAVLALAEEYGIVESDKVGNYKLKMPIKQKRENKRVIYPAFAQGQMVGERGLENVVRNLESGKGSSAQILGGLKDAVYEAMRQQAQTASDNGWGEVAERIGSTAARLRLRAQKESDSRLADIVERQAQALDSLAAEVADSGGRNVPSMFI